VVKGFASPEELEPVFAALPSTEASPELLNVLQDLKQGPTRDVAAGLIVKMLDFLRFSDTVHQANVAKLDNAYDAVKAPGKYLTLHELAEALLPGNIKSKGKFPPSALYAVHTAVMNDDTGFRPMTPLAHKRSYLFQVSSAEEVSTVRDVETLVRDHYEQYAPTLEAASETPLGLFVKKARRHIDHSRRFRPWSRHGMLGPSAGPSKAWETDWTDADWQFIKFVHLWASVEKFSLSSRLHWVGAGILRTVERYDESLYLTPSTGWTFLQEIGWTSPWDIQARYGLRLPEVHANRHKGLQRPLLDSGAPVLQEDLCEGLRRDWGSVRAYCIDSASAADIDDALSLERTEKADEFLIHVHVADPASRLNRDSGAAAMAALVPQTTYLPGHVETMFSDDALREAFSLAPDRPCLTFSARVNLEGTVLSHEITPGILRDVVYLTPRTAAEVSGEGEKDLDVGQTPFSVGIPPDEERATSRKMTRANWLSDDDKATLSTLYRLAHALHAVRLANGAMPLFWPRPSTQVSLQHTTVTKTQQGMVHCEGDPYIRISYPNSTSSSLLVESTMRLAGEVAAQWCHARGVPLPYRTQPQAARNLPQLQAFTRDVLYPQLLRGSRPADAHQRTLLDLVGPDELSATPGPHFLMGASMYAKVTSPLRRYADLLAHWQVHAALARERALGRSLAGEDASAPAAGGDGWLPFSRRQLQQQVLPLLHVRERALRALDGVEGNTQWMLQALVRAWRFGEAELPATFRFAVTSLLAGRAARGRLNWFEMSALLEADRLGPDTDLRLADLKEGDVLEVVIHDVNVHSREIFVRALGRAEEGRVS